jgi:hypothetical protein
VPVLSSHNPGRLANVVTLAYERQYEPKQKPASGCEPDGLNCLMTSPSPRPGRDVLEVVLLSGASCSGLARPLTRRSLPKSFSGAAICGFLFLLCACSGEVELYDPSQTPQDTLPTGVQKADLSLTFRIASEDSAVAQALGWPEGAVPDAEVTLSRTGSSEELTGTTDAEGSITFEKLLEGNYRASAVRILTEEERALLADPDRDVNALGGGGSFDVSAPATEKMISLAAGRPRSLVISEMSPVAEPNPAGFYSFGNYLELYNNSDTTVYLDGKLIGNAFAPSYDYPKWPCAEYERWSNDPEGIWAMFIYQFPGTGRQHPLAPGELAVIATDAIDHREYGDGAVDLSDADFEFIGTGDVDNPAAPNLVSVGQRPCCPGTTHGLEFRWPDLFVANPVDLDAVPKEVPTNYPSTSAVWRIPAEAVLDAALFESVRNSLGYPLCPNPIHDNFDRQTAVIIRGSAEGSHYSAHRRILYTLPDGRAILQHTRTSARDFVWALRSPGELP